MTFSVAQASSLYRVPVIDYERIDASGLLVASGSGIMMAVMDAAPSMRWCVDFDSLPVDSNLSSFLLLAERVADPIGICGWFTITHPDRVRELLLGLSVPPVVYGGNVRFGTLREATTLAEFIHELA